MNIKKLKEHHLWLWCIEQAWHYKQGLLSEDQMKKLFEIDFPFLDYYKLALQHLKDTRNQPCEGQHIDCDICPEMRDHYLKEMTKLAKISREDSHAANGCSYGQPDGPDDTIKECDCA